MLCIVYTVYMYCSIRVEGATILCNIQPHIYQMEREGMKYIEGKRWKEREGTIVQHHAHIGWEDLQMWECQQGGRAVAGASVV